MLVSLEGITTTRNSVVLDTFFGNLSLFFVLNEGGNKNVKNNHYLFGRYSSQ